MTNFTEEGSEVPEPARKIEPDSGRAFDFTCQRCHGLGVILSSRRVPGRSQPVSCPACEGTGEILV
jgi:DnaJ-class molecular chaperone